MRKFFGIVATLFISGVVILLASFLLLKMRTGDTLLSLPGMSGSSTNSITVNDERYKELYIQYGLNLPAFYLSLGNAAVPDSFNYIPAANDKMFLINLSRETGRPEVILEIRNLLQKCIAESKLFSPDYQWLVSREVMGLLKSDSWSQFNASFSKTKDSWKSENVPELKAVREISNKIRIISYEWKQWLPLVYFHSENQFNSWCKGWLCGNNTAVVNRYRNSRLNGLPVFRVIRKPFVITLIISFVAMVFSVLISVPSACELVLHRESKWSNRISSALLFLYSVPVFWIAVLLLIFFAGPIFLSLFPSSGIEPLEGFSDQTGGFMRLICRGSYFVLPVLALSYGGVIFFIRLLRNGLLSELKKDYIVTARASGYHERTIIYKFALKNAFYSSLTLMWITFPALLSGSVLIENVFSIPGMGSLLIRSVQNQDQPVLIGIFMLIGVITSLSFILLDILHSYFDPRLTKGIGGLYE